MTSVPKDPAPLKHKSKIPMSSQKLEATKSFHGEVLAPISNNKSHSTPNAASLASKLRPVNSNSQKRLLEKKCSALKKMSSEIKEHFIMKQKDLEKKYKDAVELRDKLRVTDADFVNEIDELMYTLTPVKKFKKHQKKIMEDSINYEDAAKFIESLKMSLNEMPDAMLEFCRKTLQEKSELLKKLIIPSNDAKSEDDLAEKLKAITAEDEESLTLEKLYANYKFSISTTVTEMNKFLTGVKTFCEMHSENITDDAAEKLEALTAELNAEKKKNMALLDKKTALENHLSECKSKIKKLEDQVDEYKRNLETRITQSQKKEANLEHIIKELKSNMEKNRESLETQIKELKKQNNLKEKELGDYKKETISQIENLSNELEDEKNKRMATEEELKLFQEKYKLLEEKSTNLCELTLNLNSFESNNDKELTENEILLYEKLESQQVTINTLNNQIRNLEIEKKQFLEIFDKNKSSVERDIESELLIQIGSNNMLNAKYEKLKQDYDKLTLESQKTVKELFELKNRMLMKADEVERDKLNLEIGQLEIRVNDLTNSLTELRERNTQLEKSLTKAQLGLESKDRELKKLQQILQQKLEIRNLVRPLASGEAASNESLKHETLEDTNKLIQEHFEIMHDKQAKIECLKKKIEYLKEQDKRAQKSRTNLENRIAMLEKENYQLKLRKSENKFLGLF